jgi:hypothetical protein
MNPRAVRKGCSRSPSPSGLLLILQKRNNKMDIFQAFATDEILENAGKWRDLSRTAKILVARTGNEKYVETLRAKMTENQLDLSSGAEADQMAEGILIDVMAETILLGWSGLTYQGKEVPYSREMAKTFLKVKDFRKKVSAFADDFEAFRVKEEKAQGND